MEWKFKIGQVWMIKGDFQLLSSAGSRFKIPEFICVHTHTKHENNRENKKYSSGGNVKIFG